MPRSIKDRFEKVFIAAIKLKGLFGIFDIVGAWLLLFRFGFLENVLIRFFERELTHDPLDFFATMFFRILPAITHAKLYAAVYLLIHGLINLLLVIGLLRRKLWVYVLAEIVFIGSIAYQISRIAHNHSIFLSIITLYDILVVVLVWIEYGRLKRHIVQ